MARSLLLVTVASLTCMQLVLSYSVDVTKFACKNSYNSSSFPERAAGKARLDIVNQYCKPLQVNMVLRHGTRNPTLGDTNTLLAVLARFKAMNVSADLVARLALVAVNFTVEKASALAAAGVIEHQGIGYRTLENFRTLLANASLDELTFSATSVVRTSQSCAGFQTGFFNQQGRALVADISIRNDLLRFYDNCSKYINQQTLKSTTAELTKFQSATFPGMIQRFLQQATFPSVSLSIDEFASLYLVAGMEYAVLGTTSWGELINPDDILTLEYAADMETYYQLGYPYPINYQQACPLLADMFQAMDSVVNTNSYKKGRFLFGHAETILPFIELLGLFKDPLPLRADNRDEQINRQFNTGNIASFASNVGLVMYSCDVEAIKRSNATLPTGIFPANPVRNMTMLTFKEAPMKFPFCNEYLCSYETVKLFYRDVVANCNLAKICAVSSSAVRTLLNISSALTTITAIITGRHMVDL